MGFNAVVVPTLVTDLVPTFHLKESTGADGQLPKSSASKHRHRLPMLVTISVAMCLAGLVTQMLAAASP